MDGGTTGRAVCGEVDWIFQRIEKRPIAYWKPCRMADWRARRGGSPPGRSLPEGRLSAQPQDIARDIVLFQFHGITNGDQNLKGRGNVALSTEAAPKYTKSPLLDE
jgi:hypothetical protein